MTMREEAEEMIRRAIRERRNTSRISYNFSYVSPRAS